MVCCCAGGGFGLRVGDARFRPSGHRLHKAQGLSEPLGSATWTHRGGSPGEEVEERPSRGATYLFCHLPGGHSRRKGAPGGHPQWLPAPGPPPPIATASPWPRLCGPVSGPMEKRRSPSVTSSCGNGASAQSLTTHDQYAAHVHTHTCTPNTHSHSRPSLLTPCGAGGQRGKRGGQKEIRGRSPRQTMTPRTRVQSQQRLLTPRGSPPSSSSRRSRGVFESLMLQSLPGHHL